MNLVHEAIHLLPQNSAISASAPQAFLTHALDHIADLPKRLFASANEKRATLYFAALADLANTYGELDASALYDAHAQTLPNGAILDTAVADAVRRCTLAMHGLAHDRIQSGPAAKPLKVWLAAAHEALTTYKRQRLPAAA